MKLIIATIIGTVSISSSAQAGISCSYYLISAKGKLVRSGAASCLGSRCHLIANIPSDGVMFRVNDSANFGDPRIDGYFNAGNKQSTFKGLDLQPNKEETNVASITFSDRSSGKLFCRKN